MVPGKSVVPLGQITLPVTFGDKNNFRTKSLCFEVVGFGGTYHAILGRLCYAKFMAIPNYTYLKLKMPRPKGIITGGVAAIVASEDLAAMWVDLVEHLDRYADAPDPKRPNLQFAPSNDVKKVLIDPQGSGSKTMTISVALSDQ